MPTSRQIFNAATSQNPSEAIVALGLDKPKTYGDIWRLARQSYAEMSEDERRVEDNETQVRLNYVASATKIPGAAPKIPDVRYTKDPE